MEYIMTRYAAMSEAAPFVRAKSLRWMLLGGPGGSDAALLGMWVGVVLSFPLSPHVECFFKAKEAGETETEGCSSFGRGMI